MFASACNMVIRERRLPPFPLLATLVGSTITIPVSLGGVSGGSSSGPLFRPIDRSSPVWNCFTAKRVRATFSFAEGVLRMRIAHSIRDFGGFSGTTGSSSSFRVGCSAVGAAAAADSAKSV